MTNIYQFISDYNIEHKTTNDKHCRAGWIQFPCPFCGKEWYLGYCIKKNNWNCWYCGFHKHYDVISSLTGLSNPSEVLAIRKKYFYSTFYIKETKKTERIKYNKKLILPPNTTNLFQKHYDYIVSRHFNPDKLKEDWDIRSCKNGSKYKFRLLIPIYFNGEIISFQTRDTTNKSDLRYFSCAESDEVIKHKNILYGIDYIKNKRGILVEGVFDCWRFGKGIAVCSFGTNLTDKQINLINERFKELFIIFDPEKTAQKEAKKISRRLNVKTYVVDIEGDKDPGDLNVLEIKKILTKLGFKHDTNIQ